MTTTKSTADPVAERTARPASAASLSRLEEDLQQLHSKWQVVEQELHDRDDAIAALEVEKADHKSTIAGLKKQLGELRDEVDRHKKTASDANARADQVDSENIDIRMSLQESRDYIDGRKGDWDKLNEQLAQYRDTIEGMSESLESHDRIVSQQEDEKAELALKLMELERSLSELKGRYAEKEASRADLQQTIEEQSHELGRLNSEMANLQDEAEESRKKLERGEATASRTQELRVADLESSLQSMQAVNEELSSEVASNVTRLDAVNTKATEQEIRIAELEALLLEAESVQSGLQQELDAQCELVKALESELNNKSDNFDYLDRSIDRLSAISSGISDLDQQIDDYRRQPRSEEIKHVFVVNNRVTGATIRYPIYSQETTIGRSSKNDIFLDSKYVSRVHAKIKVDGSKVIIEDAGSKNGFRVNSINSRRHILKNGDRLNIGSEELRYLTLAPEGTQA